MIKPSPKANITPANSPTEDISLSCESIKQIFRQICEIHDEINERAGIITSSVTGPVPRPDPELVDDSCLLGALKALRLKMLETNGMVIHLHQELVG